MKKLALVALGLTALVMTNNQVLAETCESSNECIIKGLIYSQNQDYENAIPAFKKGCDLGDRLGCNSLGYIYKNGQGVKADLKKSEEYFIKACDLNDGNSCYNVGVMEQDSNDINEFIFFKKACDLKSGNGCYRLADLYKRGDKVEPDLEKAKELFKISCDLNNDNGCFELAGIYYKNKDIENNYHEAQKYFNLGCKLDNAASCKAANMLNGKE